MYIFDKIQELESKLIIVPGEDEISREAQINGTTLFRIHLHTHLNSKKLILKERMNQESFDWLLGEIETRFNQAKVHPGEMVGSIGA